MAPPNALGAFQKYDRNASGGIEVDELRSLLKDLGLLKGLSQSDAATWVASQFAMADKKTKDGKLDLAEFTRYYEKVAAPKLLEALTAEMPAEVARLRSAFEAFASFGTSKGTQLSEMDGARFIKLCKETRLVDGQLSTTDADLAFASVKDRHHRKITFEQFLDALELVAAKKGQPLASLVRQVAASEGPEVHATQAGSVKLHDDKSAYTGVYARRSSIASDDSRRQSRGDSTTVASSRRLSGASKAASVATSAASVASRGRQASDEADNPDAESRDSLKDTFLAFAGFGLGSSPLAAKARPEMDSKQFVKLCRESGLLDRKLTATAADLAFIAKAKPLNARKIGYSQFLAALEQLAHEKNVPKEELFAQVAACKGPRLNSATVASSPSEVPPQRRSPSPEQAEEVQLEDSAATEAAVAGVNKLSLEDKVVNISAVAM